MFKVNSGKVLNAERLYYKELSEEEKNAYSISKYNHIHKSKKYNSILIEHIHVGDICFFDFGCAYRYEIGYQHLALVLAKYKTKLLVVPIISVKKTFEPCMEKAYLPKDSYNLNNNSIVLLNDMKWISGMRTLSYIGHINEKDDVFDEIRTKTIQLLFSKK